MFVSRRIAKPYLGKMDLVMERTDRLAGIMSRHGAKTSITRNLSALTLFIGVTLYFRS